MFREILIMCNPKISVIIPVYNVADYLDEALSSILNQSFANDIEVIMVDDGSTDDSRYIIEEYALDHENFHAYHKQNCGAGVARNYGLQFAKGEYVHFMDPDDYLDSQAYETLYNLAVDNDCDVVIGNAVKYDRYKIWEENLFKRSFKGIHEDMKIDSVNDRLSILWDTVLWNKLFKTDLLKSNGILFPDENIIYEDIPFTLKSYLLANSIFITRKIVYYWRLRKKSTSSTQQYENIKTFYDRIKILGLTEELMNELNVDDEIRDYEYRKWLNHDLKLFLKRLTKYSEKYYEDIISNVNRILNFIPDEFIDELNSYRKIMYRMVKNNDLESLIKFSYLENELMNHPIVPYNLDDKYHEFVDFKRDALDEDLYIAKESIRQDEDYIIISFRHHINYVKDNAPHFISAKLIHNHEEHELSVVEDRIKIPIDLLLNFKDRCYIKASYKTLELNKDAYLKSHRRQVVRLDGFDLEFGIGVNKVLTITIRKTNDNFVEVNDIDFVDEEFIFSATSDRIIENIVLENVLTFDRIEYPVSYKNYQFSFKIPYEDICNAPIRKWEIKTDSLFNSIRLPKKMYFYKRYNKTVFLNARNKILIEDDIYSNMEELMSLNNYLQELKSVNVGLKAENNLLKNENEELAGVNEKLKNRVDEYKSRKIVRLEDKVKKEM